MRLSLFSDYSLRVLIFGAIKGGPFPLHEVADSYGVSRHHLVKVVNHLTKQGYLSTRRGRGGGIELAMKPEDIHIGRLIRKTETSTPLVECFDQNSNTCPIHGCCGLTAALAQAVGAFYSALDHYTLQDVVREKEMLKSILLGSRRNGITGQDEGIPDAKPAPASGEESLEHFSSFDAFEEDAAPRWKDQTMLTPAMHG